MQVLIEEKLDGVSVALTYQDGMLVSFVTRGDGLVGQDITPNADYIPSIPKIISAEGTVYVRGEMIMEEKTFNDHFKSRPRKNKTSIPNARNQCAGLVASKNNPEDLKHLTFVAYEYWGPLRGSEIRTELSACQLLISYGFETPRIKHLVDSPESAISFYQRYDSTLRTQLQYQTDGLVLKVNSYRLQDQLGTTGGRPDFARAVKPSSKTCITKVLRIEYSQGLSGRFSPLAHVEPTILGGEVTLKAVSMHNLDYLSKWVEVGFDVGATVMVSRAGDVIPHLSGVISSDGTIHRIEGMNQNLAPDS